MQETTSIKGPSTHTWEATLESWIGSEFSGIRGPSRSFTDCFRVVADGCNTTQIKIFMFQINCTIFSTAFLEAYPLSSLGQSHITPSKESCLLNGPTKFKRETNPPKMMFHISPLWLCKVTICSWINYDEIFCIFTF